LHRRRLVAIVFLTGLKQQEIIMPDTITINAGYDYDLGLTTKQTLTVGDRVVIESVSRALSHMPPPRRVVAVVTRILGGSRSPYMEVRRPDGRLQLFTEVGTERGQDHYRATEHLRPFVSDEAEAAHAAAVRQYERSQKVAFELGKALEQAHRLLVNHPELIADCETLLKRIADVTNYRLLGKGEQILVGDEAYTWVNPECTHLDWVRFDAERILSMGSKCSIDEGHVPVRRRLPTATK
jgi:hypothetical protein